MRDATTGIRAMAIAASLSAGAFGAAAPFRMTTADLAHRDVQLTSIDASNAVVLDATSHAQATVPLASLVALRRPSTGLSLDGWYGLRTRDGQRIVCKPSVIRSDAVVCATRSLGERTIAIADVASIDLASLPDEASPSTLQQDELRLANGDRLRGIVSGADAKAVTCQTPDGQAVAVEWANVRRIHFAQTQAANPAPASSNVTLADGTCVHVKSLTVVNTTVTLSLVGGDAGVPLADVVAIEHLDGDARMLAWATPTAATYDAYFPSATPGVPSYSIDPAAAETYGATTAIVVRPRTTLRWPADGALRRLLARCVVPPGKAFADVTLRVLDGDRVAFEQKNVKSGSPPVAIDVPVSGNGSVTLVVDYGDDFDVQDVAVWLDAALLKSPAADVVK